MLVAEEGSTKTKPFRKQRSKPQVSEVFYSVSIDLYAKSIDPQNPGLGSEAKMLQCRPKILSDLEVDSVDDDCSNCIVRSPHILQSLVLRFLGEHVMRYLVYNVLHARCRIEVRKTDLIDFS
jgi:hypothetical protein